jgi:hypothetical protein
MPGHCTFARTGGVWVLVEKCATGGKECPPIANYKLDAAANATDSGKEAAFLATFKAAYGNSFTFNDTDELKLACDNSAAESIPHSVYKRNNENDREFDLKKVAGQEFRQIIKVVPPS